MLYIVECAARDPIARGSAHVGNAAGLRVPDVRPEVVGVSSVGMRPSECDRCGRQIHDLEPVTTIQFSGGVDAHRMVCADCIEVIVEVWNEGDAVESQSDRGGE